MHRISKLTVIKQNEEGLVSMVYLWRMINYIVVMVTKFCDYTKKQ